MTKLEKNKTYTKPTYGGSTTYVEYDLTHVNNNITNNYELTFEVRISHSELDVYLQLTDVKALDNNEETLTFEGVSNLLEI